MWSEYDTTYGRYGSFSNVQLFLDKQRYQHEETSEASYDQVRPMRLVDAQLLPRHGCLLISVSDLFLFHVSNKSFNARDQILPRLYPSETV